MPTPFDELVVELRAKTDKLDLDLRTATSKLEDATKKMQDSAKGSAAAFEGLNAAVRTLKVALPVSAIINYTRLAINAGDAMGDLSKRTDVSVETLSKFEYLARLSGTSLESFATAFKFMNKTLGDAAQGSQMAQSALAQLGLRFEELRSLSPEQQFIEIADRIDKLGNIADKTKVSMEIFGRSGSDLIPAMEGGADAIRKMNDEAERLGLVLGEDEVKRMQEFNDKWDTMTLKLERLAQNGFSAVYESIVDVIDAYNILIGQNDRLTDEGLVKALKRVQDKIKDTTSQIELLNEAIRKAQQNPGSYAASFLGMYEKRSVDLNAQLSALYKELAEINRLSGQTFGPQQQDGIQKTSEVVATNTVAVKKLAQAHEQAATSITSHIEAIKKVTDYYSDDIDVLRQWTDQMRDAGVTARDDLELPLTHAFENIQDALADMLVEGQFTFDSLAAIGKRAAAEIAAAWIIKPSMQALFGGVGIGGNGSSSGLVSGGGSLLSGLKNGFGTPIFDPLSTAFDVGDLLGLDTIQSVNLADVISKFTPGAALAGVGGNILGNLLLGNRGLGSDVGGTLGGLAGTALGGPVGAFLGSTLGNAIGGLFGGKTPHPASTFGSTFGDTSLSGTYFNSKHMDTSFAQALASQVDAIVRSLESAGIDLPSGMQIHGGVDQGRFGGGFIGIGGLTNLIKFNANDAAAVDEAMKNLIEQLAELGTVTNADVIESLKDLQTEGKSTAEVLDELVSAATKQQREQLQELTDRNSQLITDQRNAMAALTDSIQSAQRAAEEFGRAAERLQDTIDSLNFGAGSALSPEQQYALASSRFGDLSRRANMGDLAAINALPDAARTFLDESRGLFGSNATYKGDFALTQNALAAAIGVSSSQAATQRATATRLQTEFATLQNGGSAPMSFAGMSGDAIVAEIRRLGEEQAQTNRMLQDLASDINVSQAARRAA